MLIHFATGNIEDNQRLTSVVPSQLACRKVAGSRPFGTAVDGTGAIFVSELGASKVTKWENHEDKGTAWSGSGPLGMTMDSEGHLITAFENEDCVMVGLPGVSPSRLGVGELGKPYDVALDDAESILVADSSKRIMRYSQSSSGVWSSKGTQVIATVGRPFGVFVRDRATHVAEDDPHYVKRWEPPYGSGTVVAANGLFGPRGLFMDQAGILYVSDRHNDRVLAWTPDAEQGVSVIGTVDGLALNRPAWMFSSSNHLLYIADAGNNRVLEHFTLFGVLIKGYVQTIVCARFQLLTHQGLQQLVNGPWYETAGAMMFWCLLLLLAAVVACATAMDKHSGWKMARNTELFVIPLKPEESAALKPAAQQQAAQEAGCEMGAFLLHDKDTQAVVVDRHLERQKEGKGPSLPTVDWWQCITCQDIWARLHLDAVEGIGNRVPKQVCSHLVSMARALFVVEKPFGAIFTLDLFITAKTKAMLYSMDLLGSLAVVALFFSAAGNMKGRPAMNEIESMACSDESLEDDLVCEVGRAMAVTVGSTLCAGIPATMIESLDTIS